MRTVAAMLSGGNREHVILQAAKCAEPFVDAFICINTGPSADIAIGLMREKYGDMVAVVETDQSPYRLTSQGRNQCLREAEKLGFDWALLLDTDMILDARGDDIRGFLETTAHKIVSYNSPGEWRQKPLWYRLPADYGQWADDPHEWFATNEPSTLLPTAMYWEQGKSRDEQRALCASVVEQILTQPLNTRNLWYLADAYDQLGQHDNAVQRFTESATMCGGDFAGSGFWRIAKIHEFRGEYAEGIAACDSGLSRCPTYPEFDWLASVLEYRRGNYTAARDRALRALALGEIQSRIPRTSWSNKRSWREGPLESLAFAFAALGDFAAESAARKAMAECP